MTRQDRPIRTLHILMLTLAAFFFLSILFLFKAAITGKASFDIGSTGNLTVTFDAQPVPADAVVVARISGVESRRPLRAFIASAPQSIISGESSVQGYHEPITISLESFGIDVPTGIHNLSIEILHDDNLIDRIVVPVQATTQSGLFSRRIAAPKPPREQRTAFPFRALIVGLGTLSFLAALLIVLFHYHLLSPPPDLLETQDAIGELAGRIHKERAKGHSDRSTMQKLHEIASHEEIIAAFVQLDGSTIRSYIRSNEKKGYSQAQIRLALERRHPKDVVDEVFDRLD